MIYLDNAASSFPKPPSVINAVADTLKNNCANPGRSGHSMSVSAGRLVLSAREQLQTLYNAPDPFCFTFGINCTDALNTAIEGVLSRGDHVVTTAYEHNSVLRVLYHLNKALGITYSVVFPDSRGMITPDLISLNITPSTRLVICNHISNVTGIKQPIEEICQLCRDKGILFLLDGAQSAGLYNPDLSKLPIDMMAVPGHKGLLGPQGTGALYVRPDLELSPLKHGGTGSDSLQLAQPATYPDKLESGTLNVPGIAGLSAGIEYVRRKQAQIKRNELSLAGKLIDGLKRINGLIVYSPLIPQSGVVLFNIPNIASVDVADMLDRDYSICCRAGYHCAPLAHDAIGTLETGAVRLSIGHGNTILDIESCISAIKEISRRA